MSLQQLFTILLSWGVMAPLLKTAAADLTACEHSNRSPSDAVLDADDVRDVEFVGRRLCNFSNGGYSHVCDDAFQNTGCEEIDLSDNELTEVSEKLFPGALNLRTLFLPRNQFIQAPVIQNYNLEWLVLDGNPIRKIANNFTGGVPNLRVLSLQNLGHLDDVINDSTINRSSGRSPLIVKLNGTKPKKLPESCWKCVQPTTKEVHPGTVDISCYDCTVTLESIRPELLISQTNPQDAKNKADVKPPTGTSKEHPEVPDDGSVPKSVVTGLSISGSLLVIIVIVVVFIRLITKRKLRKCYKCRCSC